MVFLSFAEGAGYLGKARGAEYEKDDDEDH
jgi:hypothetical protein